MSFNFAKYLLQSSEYNGHKEATVKKMSLDDAMLLIKELEELDLEDQRKPFVIELWSDGSYGIHRKDRWKQGEHTSGHTDQLILSVDSQ